MSDRDVSERLSGLETRLGRLETLLGELHGKLDHAGVVGAVEFDQLRHR